MAARGGRQRHGGARHAALPPPLTCRAAILLKHTATYFQLYIGIILLLMMMSCHSLSPNDKYTGARFSRQFNAGIVANDLLRIASIYGMVTTTE